MDNITAFLGLFSTVENQYLMMFLSALLSATLLPGNSEIIFTTFVSQAVVTDRTFFSPTIMGLLLSGTIGNSLGSIITYSMGWLIPKPIDHQNRSVKWALEKSEKYGVWILLLSSLPIVGDILCAIAGWLRFNFWLSVLFITLGKLIRYLLLLAAIYPVVQFLF